MREQQQNQSKTHTGEMKYLINCAYAILATPITRFSGEEQPDGETFQDCLEQFESMAQLGGWNSHAKLVNLSIML